MEKAKLKRSSLPRKHRGKKLRLSRSLGGNIVLLLFLAIVGAFYGAAACIYAYHRVLKPVEELFHLSAEVFCAQPHG